MGDLARGAHFSEKAPQPSGVRVESPRQELEGDRLSKLQIVGPVDLTHAPLPQQPHDPLAAGEDGARKKPCLPPGAKREEPGRRAAGSAPGGRFSVGNAEEDGTGWPQDPQKRLPAGRGREQLGHRLGADIPRNLSRPTACDSLQPGRC